MISENWKNNISPYKLYSVTCYFNFSKDILDRILELNGLSAYFPDDSGRAEFSNLNFQIEEFNFSSSFHGKYYDKTIEKSIVGIYQPNIRFGYSVKEKMNLKSVYFQATSESFPEDLIRILIQEFSTNLKFIVIYNPHFSHWENLITYNHYKFKGGLDAYDHYGSKRVDLSNRPGRVTMMNNNWYFKGANEYWFGKYFYESHLFVNLDTFDNCSANKELANGIRYIKLFELERYWDDRSQEILQDFRDFLKIDEYKIK